ncbi:MAG: alcohol dehydrogenase catalytic domain-containing protein, partial [Deltaproteobacteria bacterium]|nr:alcohol dehydrogenase catalytic domain-containing protein [Deltaproteobacteria bacterium]
MRTEASGICGSDVLEWYRLKKAPLVLGHEVAGQVVKIGKKVARFKVGDRIVANHHVPCNTCSFCLTGHHTACNTLRSTNFEPGGFSEYIRIPAINVDRGTVIRAKRMAGLKPGQSVLVLGSGIAGILILHYARQAGAGLILAVEPIAYRRKAALKFGANEAISPLEDIPAFLRKINRGRL